MMPWQTRMIIQYILFNNNNNNMSTIKSSDILAVKYVTIAQLGEKPIKKIMKGNNKIWGIDKEVITDKQSLTAQKYADKYLRYNCDFSGVTDLTKSFYGNYYINNLVLDGTANVKVWGAGDSNGAFSNCPNLVSIKLATDNATSFDGIFDSTTYVSEYYANININTKLTSIEFNTTKNVATFHSAFRSENSLTSLKGIDFSSCLSINAMFYRDGYKGISGLRIFTAKNFGRQKDLGSTNQYGFDCLLNWGVGSAEAHNSVYDTLYTYSYNRVANGYPTLTVKLSPNTMSILTAEEKAAITAKGYTLTT